MTVDIYFRPTFAHAMRQGRKTCTSRPLKMASPGDTFIAFGAEFKVVRVEPRTLAQVRERLFQQEGCTTPGDFEAIWRSIHPRVGFEPQRMVWVHHFVRIA